MPLMKLGPDPEEEIGQHVALMDASGIDRSIIINTQFHPDLGVYRPNAALARQRAKFPDRFDIIAGVRLHPTPDLGELEYAVRTLGCVGVKIVPAVAYVRPDDFDLLGPLYEACIDLDVPIMWHIGDSGLPAARAPEDNHACSPAGLRWSSSSRKACLSATTYAVSSTVCARARTR